MPYIKAEDWRDIQARLASVDKGVITDNFEGLKASIKADAREVSAATVANALLHQVCIPHNCREETFVMETGESVRTQPFRLTDSVYKLVSLPMLESIIEETKVDSIRWRSESYDCEDIVRKFVTRCVDLGINSVGRVFSWSGGHAFNIGAVHVDGELAFKLIEPQTDRFVEPQGEYSLENALIIIS